MLRAVKAEVLVRRNQGVLMRIEGAGFTVSGVGEAMEDGRAGDVIKVRNVDSRRVVSARVAGDGAVEPIIDEVKP
jgi:flagella basal body P-ring formation protein FlgA